MCERYTRSVADAPRFNIAHGQAPPVATADGVVAMRWGMLAPWRGHGGKRPPMIYVASVDAIDTTPLLRAAMRSQRCLVLADGFYAWRRVGKKSIPYWIHAEGVTAFAGVWTSRDDNQPSFAMLVGPAAGRSAMVSDTAPIVATEAWLADAQLERPFDAWRAEAVSTFVNDIAHDDPRCIAPLGNPAQRELF